MPVKYPRTGGGGGGGGGVSSINSDVTAAQVLNTGTAGTNFTITDAGGGVHTFNLPVASAVNTGKLSNTDWSTFNAKVSGPVSSTDNALVRWDGTTGQLVQNSNGLLTDAGDLTIVNMAAFGNSASYGSVGGAMRFLDQAWTVTDFSAVNSWRIDSARFIVDPAVSSTSDVATARYSIVSTAALNVNDFGTLLAENNIAQHSGSGTITLNLGSNNNATINGAGNITTNAATNHIAQALSGATGTITNNFGQVIVTGTQAAGATITNNYGTVHRTPSTTGTITVNRAIYAETQAVGGTSHFIYSEGGQSYHEGNLGLGVITPLSKLHVAGSQTIQRTPVGAGLYNVLATDYYIAKTAITGGGDTLVLPAAATVGAGKIYKIKDVTGTAATNNLTISPTGGDTIELGATFTMNINGGSSEFISDGVSNWEVN